MNEAMKKALKEAIRRAEGQNGLARLLGISQPRVHYWLHKGGKLPAEYVLRVEELTGVSRHELRPDIYPREEVA